MDNSNSIESPNAPGTTKRRRIALSDHQLIGKDFLSDGRLRLWKPAIEALNLVNWAASNREHLAQELLQHGAILFRGFNVQTVDEFERFMKSLTGELIDYSYRSTPRTQVSGKIYTSTEYPAHQNIPLHNEMSFTRQWPMMLGFFCIEAAEEGGETPIADSRKVYRRIDSLIRDRFTRQKVRYVRNYDNALDLTWQDVFQTTTRADVESFCRESGIEFEWNSDDGLCTSSVCQAVAEHPRTGEMVWFNQAHLFHVTNLQTEIRESLLESYGGAPPRNAFYGDGSLISESDLEVIRAAYADETIIFPWQDGDILLLDNMLTAHGRRPYKGRRQIVVGMGQLFSA